MVWIRLWLSCAAFLSAAGGISYGLVRLSERLWKPANPVLLLTLQKTGAGAVLGASVVCVDLPQENFV